MKRFFFICIFSYVILGFIFALNSYAHDEYSNFDSIIGDNDALMIMDKNYNPIFSKNANKKLTPASTLKILTALSAFYYLGENFKFKTEFYIDNSSNLIIKGYGDPLLISESISACCNELSRIVMDKKISVNDIILDHSYFEPFIAPGVTSPSYEPYDAPSGALCANFNTVSFFYNKKHQIVSAEAQTPLVPLVLSKIKKSGLKQGRILLNSDEGSVYAGFLIKDFLNKRGINVKGNIRLGKLENQGDQLIYSYESPFSLKDIIIKLLRFSNNFIANQLFVTIGAKAFGAPGTLEKGINAVNKYAENQLGLTNISIVEGSGISRENKLSARDMALLLKEFQNHRTLMRTKNNEFYKTGTLEGVSTRIGYFTIPDKGLFPFVIFLNTPHKKSEKIEGLIYNILCNSETDKSD